MRICRPRVFEAAQLSFDMALHSALERIVTASGPGFGDWQWRLATLPFALGGLGVYSACGVLNYAFAASHLQSVVLQTKLLRHVGIVATDPTFDDALCVFNKAMEIDFLSTPSESDALKHKNLKKIGKTLDIVKDNVRSILAEIVSSVSVEIVRFVAGSSKCIVMRREDHMRDTTIMIEVEAH
ncbi:hypothetical protein Tco_0410047 [Tanacetum coccineum]